MKKRKTDLFRFVTLRAPELISSNRKGLGFIFHPDPTASEFLDSVDEADIPGSKIAIDSVANTFTPLETVEAIKTMVTQPVWDFSIWLSKNKNKIIRSELDSQVPTLPASMQGSIYILWDNIFYDILKSKNPYVRQAAMHIIVAKNFIDNYATYSPGITTDEEEMKVESELLKRLINGKVVIHRVFGTEKSETINTSLDYNLTARRRFEAVHQAKLASCILSSTQEVYNEIADLEDQYNSDFTAARDSALSEYNSTASSEFQTFLTQNPDVTVTSEEDIPDDAISKFTFSYDKPLSTKYTEGKLSTDAENYLNEHRLRHFDIKSALDYVKGKMKSTKKDISKSKRKKFANILINGVSIKKGLGAPKDFALSFEPDPLNPGRFKAIFSLDAGYRGAFIASQSSRLTVGETSYNSDCPEVMCDKDMDSIIFVELFPGAGITLGDCENIIFETTITLDNGQVIRIYKTSTTKLTIFSGIALVDKGEGSSVETYGVNRMGIADYRRVEQELCCYIPGEVSHIENILAKEYKEKSTRNLMRTEITVETTSEREVENQTDTSSTTRDEVSSEISEVLQKDRSQNFGFSASAGGDLKPYHFNASAYGDFGFSQSSTDSNSEARTYAEDVTRRALERVVQKNTITRTSKILKEYEENNKHGYDNREGEEHVTGVYRWIDKVYKNSLVNYGKRLMYEFMVPEPSRWYKEAIIVEVEEETNTTAGGGTESSASIAVMPVHPSEEGIRSAENINRDNYKTYAALYGANPEAPQDQNVSVPFSKSESIGGTDSEQSFSYDPIMIPGDYICKQIIGTATFNHKANWGNAAYLDIGAGGQITQSNRYNGEGNQSMSINHYGLNLTASATVGAVSKKMKSFAISLQFKCEWKQHLYEQWQSDVYDEIMRAYTAQKQAFENEQQAQALAAEVAASTAEAETDQARSSNPRFNSEIVKTELKRLCIEMITKPYEIQQGADFYQYDACEVPGLELSNSLDVYASNAKFFEQAFDWDLMAQKFYPYYWAKRCDWKDLIQTQDGTDRMFQDFLQSGLGRIIVPVREGFEDAVTFFMETGKVWSGTGLVMDTDDDLYLSIVDEMTTIEGQVEGEEWETIVPSSLTIVQNRSVKLMEDGLPCCDSVEASLLNFEVNNETLTPPTDPAT